jgi:hypothetical protein
VTETIVHIELRYRMKSTGASSHTLGQCEVCRTHVAEVFLLVKEQRQADGDWRYGDPSHIFGHEACLQRLQGGASVCVADIEGRQRD